MKVLYRIAFQQKMMKKMEKSYVKVVYDRRKRADVTGMGQVELQIYFSRNERKYICINECNPIAWRKYQKSDEFINEVNIYKKIIERMIDDGEELTIDNFSTHLGQDPSEKEKKSALKKYSKSESFIDFMRECIRKEHFSKGTNARKKVTIEAMLRDSISLSRLSSRLFISRSTLSLLAGAMLELLTIPNPFGVRMMSRCGIALRNASKATMRAIVTFADDGSGRSAMSSKISFGQKLSMSHFV